jgi:hypothetical protein
LQRDLRSATDIARQNLIAMQEKIEELNAVLDLAQSERAEPTQSPQAKPDAVEPEPDATPPQARSAMAQPPAPEQALAAKPSSVSPAAASIEGAAVKAANVELEKLIDTLVADSTSASGTARSDPIMTEGPMPEANAVLAVSRSEEVAPTRGPKPEPVQEKREAAASQAPPSTAQAPALGPAIKVHADRPSGSATKLAMAGPTESPLVDSGVELFNANLQHLNELELKAGGSDLFSGIESAKGSEVRVSTTAAWDKLPSVGQEAYVNTLLDSWVSARGGKGPAVVRLVNSSGQVLVEKSWQ